MEEKRIPRELGPDLARSAAGVLVLSVHFFLNGGFYQTPVAGGAMLLSCVARMLCMTCVPLFLLLTGYTCVHREWSWGYYRKLIPVLATYALAGAVCVAYRALALRESLSPLGVIGSFLNFSAAPYAWYIEMYIGLFLLSPFFNAAWRSLRGGAKGALVLSLAAMTALPTCVNQWGAILPDWWVGIYPLTYYALGAWLRERPLKAKGWQLLALWAALAALMGVKGYLSAGGGAYVWMPEDEWGSWPLTLQAALLFSCLVRVSKAPRPLEWCVHRMAALSLGMYLTSWVADQVVYPRLIAAIPAAHRRIFWMPAAVLATVTLSCLMAQGIEWIRRILSRCFGRMVTKRS